MARLFYAFLLLLLGGTIICLLEDRRRNNRLIDKLLLGSAKDKYYIKDLEKEVAELRIRSRRKFHFS